MILSVLAVALGMAPSAAAIPPDIVEDEFDFEDFPVGDCGTFVILGSAHVQLRVLTFFDRDGDPESVQIHVLRRGIFANSVTGDSVTDWGDFVVILDFEAGTQTHVGLEFLVRDDGGNIVALDAGRVVLPIEVTGPEYFEAAKNFPVLFEAGRHDLLHSLDPLCEALG